MELGNMIFGHSRGEHPMPRSEGFEGQLQRLFAHFGLDEGYGSEFESPTFEVHPYYWGECTCGFEERWSEKEDAWMAEHPHAPDCYQTELAKRTSAYDRESDYTAIHDAAFKCGDVLLGAVDMEVTDHGNGCTSFAGNARTDEPMERWREAYEKRNKAMDEIYAELCQKFGLPAVGCAVHCTCGRDEAYAAFASTDEHDARCPIVLPNFLFKPTGYSLMWYKYPLRDAYASHELTMAEFSAMIDQCIATK